MDVNLHIGAHRSASTSFQAYLRANTAALERQGLCYWGRRRTRSGLFAGIIPVNGSPRLERQTRLAYGWVALQVERMALKGMQHLVVTDENMIGAPRRNLRDMVLYRGAGERMARYAAAFGGRITQVVPSIRAFDSYGSSTLAYGIVRGHALPEPVVLEAWARQTRGWRDLFMDMHCALPDAELLILPHETYGSVPERRLEIMTAGKVIGPLHEHRLWLNRAPDLEALLSCLAQRGEEPELLGPEQGRYDPFTSE